MSRPHRPSVPLGRVHLGQSTPCHLSSKERVNSWQAKNASLSVRAVVGSEVVVDSEGRVVAEDVAHSDIEGFILGWDLSLAGRCSDRKRIDRGVHAAGFFRYVCQPFARQKWNAC